MLWHRRLINWFIFQQTEYPCNNTYDISFLYIPLIFLEHFLRVNVTFYDALNMIHDVIRTANPFPYTTKFMLVGFGNDETQ